jgi:hypothetical protein
MVLRRDGEEHDYLEQSLHVFFPVAKVGDELFARADAHGGSVERRALELVHERKGGKVDGLAAVNEVAKNELGKSIRHPHYALR